MDRTHFVRFPPDFFPFRGRGQSPRCTTHRRRDPAGIDSRHPKHLSAIHRLGVRRPAVPPAGRGGGGGRTGSARPPSVPRGTRTPRRGRRLRPDVPPPSGPREPLRDPDGPTQPGLCLDWYAFHSLAVGCRSNAGGPEVVAGASIPPEPLDARLLGRAGRLRPSANPSGTARPPTDSDDLSVVVVASTSGWEWNESRCRGLCESCLGGRPSRGQAPPRPARANSNGEEVTTSTFRPLLAVFRARKQPRAIVR